MLSPYLEEVLLLFMGFPPLADLDRFPDMWDAGVQVERCQEHEDRLRWYAGIQGYDRWDGAIEKTKDLQRYWKALYLAHSTSGGEEWQRFALKDFKKLIGPEKYMKGWRPTLMPDKDEFVSPLPSEVHPFFRMNP